MKHFNQIQAQFMDACGQPRYSLAAVISAYDKGYCNAPLLAQQIQLWRELISEEVTRELFRTLTVLTSPSILGNGNAEKILAQLADDIADSIYVLCGLGNCVGIPVDTVFLEVHRANMSKAVRQADGSFKVTRRADGKILKPNDWQPPNVAKIIKEEAEKKTDLPVPSGAKYAHSIIKARQLLQDHELGLMIDQGNFNQVQEILQNAISSLEEGKRALSSYEQERRPFFGRDT